MSQCVECGCVMDRFEAEEYLDCRRCRDAMKSKSKIKKIKSITRSTRFDSGWSTLLREVAIGARGVK